MDDKLRALGVPAPSRARRLAGRIIGVVVALVIVAGGVLAWRSRRPSETHFEEVAVERGELVATVSATGTLRPRDAVDVGPEVSGRVARVHVDVNDTVTEGQLLAEIDTTQIEAQIAEARANVQQAQAQVQLSTTSLEEARTTATRTAALTARELASAAELDTARAAVGRAEAQLDAARAQTAVARAALTRATTDLTRARIVSPIAGIVLTRAVEAGQSVAATLSSPVFFQIAADLESLELEVDVDEADMGRVREGLESTFTVDAYPDRTFHAEISRLAFASHLVNNVVSYQALLRVENPGRLLRPGMTATATIITERTTDQLLVPNAALRFEPPLEQRFGGPRRPTAPDGPHVWTLAPRVEGSTEPRSPQPLGVRVLGTDGRRSSITAEGLAEGTLVVTGLERSEAAAR